MNNLDDLEKLLAHYDQLASDWFFRPREADCIYNEKHCLEQYERYNRLFLETAERIVCLTK